MLLSAFNYSKVLAVLAAAAVVLTAGYILWTLQRVFLGGSEQYKGLPDMTIREVQCVVSEELTRLPERYGLSDEVVAVGLGAEVRHPGAKILAAGAACGVLRVDPE